MTYWPRISSDEAVVKAAALVIHRMAKDELSADQGQAIVNCLDKLLRMRQAVGADDDGSEEHELLAEARQRAESVLCDPVVAGDEK
jgi:hypothetical protein